GIAGQRLAIGVVQVAGFRYAAGVGVLDDHASRGASGIEFGDAFIGRVGIVDVVVRQFLALYLAGGGNAYTLARRPIEGRALVRVLAIAQRLDQLAAESAVVGRAVVQRLSEPVGDRRVIGGGARIGFRRQLLAQLERGH